MSTFAIVKDGVVVNVVVADNQEIALDVCSKQYGNNITVHECVGENQYIGINWTYNGSSFISPDDTITE